MRHRFADPVPSCHRRIILEGPKSGIEALLLQQLIMASRLDNLPIDHPDDEAALPHRGEPMRDYDDGAILTIWRIFTWIARSLS